MRKKSNSLNIDKQTDERLRMIINRQGVTIILCCSYQTVDQVMRYLALLVGESGKRLAWLSCVDYQASNLFYNFCNELTEQLGLRNRLENEKRALINATRCISYVRREILLQLDSSCVMVVYNAESLLGTTKGDLFFGMLRTWHNLRSREFAWRRLDIVIITSTEVFIKDPDRTPFNVGEIIKL